MTRLGNRGRVVWLVGAALLAACLLLFVVEDTDPAVASSGSMPPGILQEPGEALPAAGVREVLVGEDAAQRAPVRARVEVPTDAPPAADRRPDRASLVGCVLSDSGFPAASVLLSFSAGEDRRETRSNEDGTFVLEGLEPGTWTPGVDPTTVPEGLMLPARWLRSNELSYAPVSRLELEPGSRTSLLVELARPARLEGRVVDPEGRTVRGARVELEGASLRRALTDEAGRYVFVRLLPGDYRIRAELPVDHPTAYRDAPVPATVRVLPGRSAVEPDLVAGDFGLSVIGRVVDPEGTPLAGATVSILDPGRRVSTSDDGTFQILRVEEDRVTLHVRPPGSNVSTDFERVLSELDADDRGRVDVGDLPVTDTSVQVVVTVFVEPEWLTGLGVDPDLVSARVSLTSESTGELLDSSPRIAKRQWIDEWILHTWVGSREEASAAMATAILTVPDGRTRVRRARVRSLADGSFRADLRFP